MMNNHTARKIFILFLPIFFELLLINLLSSVDTIMLRSYNTLCVNAVGTASSTLSLLTILIVISSNGVAITVGQFLGAKKNVEAKDILSQGILFNFLLGLLLMLLFFFFGDNLLSMANTKKSFFSYASIYIHIYSIALPFQAITQVIAANFRAYGKPFYMMVVSILSNVINVILNYLLIFGVGVFPELGIKGAAIATVSSLIFKTICGIILELCILKCRIIPKTVDFKILKNIIKIGGPSALESTCYTICSFVLVASLNKLSDEEIGSKVFINLALGYTLMFSSALSQANAILVARFVGANEYTRVKRLTIKTTLVGVGIIVFCVSLMNIFGHWLFMLIANDSYYVSIIVRVLPLIYILEIGRCVNLIVIGAQKAAGDVFFPLILGCISMSIIMAFGSYFFTAILPLGLAGILLAQGLDELFRAIVSVVRWMSGGWQNKSIVKE